MVILLMSTDSRITVNGVLIYEVYVNVVGEMLVVIFDLSVVIVAVGKVTFEKKYLNPKFY